jgi:hypothetical protein
MTKKGNRGNGRQTEIGADDSNNSSGSGSANRIQQGLDDQCVIPPRLPVEVAGEYMVERSEVEERQIVQYMETQAWDEKVTHLEKVASERIYGRTHDAWDVWTDKGRWWVVTSPTNLYSHEHFPSLDYTLSFHVGLMARIGARQASRGDQDEEECFAASWRRFRQASDALDRADEAEDFQAVGMRCRECMLELVREAALMAMVPAGAEPPKMGDFVHWAELIANHVAPGDRNQRVRGYLKALSQSTWELVQWLTHTSSASRFDGVVAVDATQNVISAFGLALIRKESSAPERCPACGSYQLIADVRTDDGIVNVTVCKRCGWESEPVDPFGDSGDS